MLVAAPSSAGRMLAHSLPGHPILTHPALPLPKLGGRHQPPTLHWWGQLLPRGPTGAAPTLYRRG